MTEITVTHNPVEKRFEVQAGDCLATLSYDLEEGRIIFTHTEVPPACEGQGIGSALAREGLEHARREGLGAVVLCQFMKKYVNRHPEYLDLIQY